MPIRTTKRKASSDENVPESKSARKLSKKKHQKSGHGLLNGLNFNGKDFEQDLSAMYTEIRRCLVVESPTEPEKALKEMTSEEYQDYKKRLDKEQVLWERDFRAAVNKGILNLTPAPRGCM